MSWRDCPPPWLAGFVARARRQARLLALGPSLASRLANLLGALLVSKGIILILFYFFSLSAAAQPLSRSRVPRF